MLNLIKSDLYRITRPRGLRGSFWQYGIAIIVVYALITAMVMFANSPLYHEMAGVTIGNVMAKDSVTVYFADMMGGIVPLCVCFMAVEHALSEFKNGYIKTVLSARSGRLSYFAGKIVFAGVMSAPMVAFGAVTALLCIPFLMGGNGFAAGDAPLEIVAWFVGFWFNTWAVATLSLVLAYATRVSPVSYIGAFCIEANVVPQFLMGLAYSAGGYLSFLQPVRPVLETIALWAPSTSLSNLGRGADIFRAASAGAWGPMSQALAVSPGIQALITGAIGVAVATVLVLALARKRDI